MRTSLQWLRSLVPSLDASDEEIVKALKLGGFDVRSTVVLRGELAAVAPREGEVPGDMPIEQAVPAAFDTIVDIADTERADVLGHVGVARQVATLFGLPFAAPGVDAPIRVAEGAVESRIDVDVHDPEGCHHYGLVVVEEVQVAPAPLWLRVRLHALGLEPRNNVVDLANLVTLESGHPVMVYDLDQLAGALFVRRAKQGEAFVMAQGAEQPLEIEDLVVADARGPVALAGVTTAARSQVSTATRRVVLTCACFDPATIAHTADRCGLDTETSRRHRRGVDCNDTAEVLAQAGALVTRLAKGAAVPGAIHVFESPGEARQLVLHQKALGGVSPQRAKAILELLGFDVVPLHAGPEGSGMQVSVPSFRGDIGNPAELAREVARVSAVWNAAGIG